MDELIVTMQSDEAAAYQGGPTEAVSEIEIESEASTTITTTTMTATVTVTVTATIVVATNGPVAGTGIEIAMTIGHTLDREERRLRSILIAMFPVAPLRPGIGTGVLGTETRGIETPETENQKIAMTERPRIETASPRRGRLEIGTPGNAARTMTQRGRGDITRTMMVGEVSTQTRRGVARGPGIETETETETETIDIRSEIGIGAMTAHMLAGGGMKPRNISIGMCLVVTIEIGSGIEAGKGIGVVEVATSCSSSREFSMH
jgi:hypothetical protein